MLKLYRENKLFYNLFFLFTFVGAIILALTKKGEVEIFVNKYNNPVFDILFYYLTYLGDGILITLFIIILLARKIYLGISGAIICIISTIITQLLKRTIFSEFPRPKRFFDPSQGLRFLDNLDIHEWNSFPSGHASGAFTILLYISLISKKPLIQAICFFLAMLAAFSRVYLLQHFFMDIYAGTIMGVIITTICYFLIEEKTGLPKNPKFNRSLADIFK